ncbi:hypothetical protein JNO04_03940 [Halomonas sp. MC140]|nr:hypothetical protein [Halomonas sp. MC140]MDN7131502.1 hypothetical protein [Halomonas sp. MC140]
MMKKSLAFLAIAGMLASPLALAQTAPAATRTPPTATGGSASTSMTTTSGGVAGGGAATGGLAGALGVSTTVLVVGAASLVVLGVAVASADSAGSSGTTGTN